MGVFENGYHKGPRENDDLWISPRSLENAPALRGAVRWPCQAVFRLVLGQE